MKKILIFIDWFLPGYKAGGPIRSYANLIDHFKGEYQFYIVTRNTDYTETEPYPNITPDSWTEFDGNVQVWYCSQGFPSRKNFKTLIQNTEWDVLYINGIYSWFFSILPLIIGKKNVKGKIVVSVRGMLKRSAVNVKQGKKKLFIKLIKRLNLYRGITLHATNEEEKQDIIQNFGEELNIRIAPNLPRKINGDFQTKDKQPGTLNLISIARISPEKNTLYALEVLKHLSLPSSPKPSTPNPNSQPKTPNSNPQSPVSSLRSPVSDLLSPISGLPSSNSQLQTPISKLPTLNLTLHGTIYNPQYWEECQKIISELPDWIQVTYMGSLDSNEVPATLSQSHIMFMPTRGENYGHAILESFSAGCPVIISDQTPWRNLEEKNIGWDIALDNKQKFIETITKCLAMDKKQYDKMSKASYNYAQQIINNPEVINANRALFA